MIQLNVIWTAKHFTTQSHVAAIMHVIISNVMRIGNLIH